MGGTGETTGTGTQVGIVSGFYTASGCSLTGDWGIGSAAFRFSSVLLVLGGGGDSYPLISHSLFPNGVGLLLVLRPSTIRWVPLFFFGLSILD